MLKSKLKTMLVVVALCALSSCKTTSYTSTLGNTVQTNVVLSQANFEVLGSFTGTASAKINRINILKTDSSSDNIGLIAQAKENLMINMISKGYLMTGSRTLINVTIDQIENKDMIVITMSADLIEFK